MNINDLNHLEIVSEETNVMGAFNWSFYFPTAQASALADSIAIGTMTSTTTITSTQITAGLFSHSTSLSTAVAIG